MMGLFKWMQASAARKRADTMLALIFQENDFFARTAMNLFQRCLFEHGHEFSEMILVKARMAVSADNRITFGRFIEVYLEGG